MAKKAKPRKAPSIVIESVSNIYEIVKERQAHPRRHGWTKEHDDGHRKGEIARAAAYYAMPEALREFCDKQLQRGRIWPWDECEFRPSVDRRRELIKAGALILAELDRLDRLAAREPIKKETRPVLDSRQQVVQMDQRATILSGPNRGCVGYVVKVGSYPGRPKVPAAMVRDLPSTSNGTPEWSSWVKSKDLSIIPA